MPQFTEEELQALRACAHKPLKHAALQLGLSVKNYYFLLNYALEKAAQFINSEVTRFLHLLNYRAKRQIAQDFLRAWEKQTVTMDDPMF